jgi:predicted CoA-substrate-specific enzyme activase
MKYAGIDAGSRAVKIVLYDADTKSVVDHAIADQSVNQANDALKLYNTLLEKNKLSDDDISYIVATGYGRDHLSIAGDTVTEITCHAKGVRFLNPEARTIIEIGGQDSKLIKLDENGAVKDFSMNDRCAAGTGRFLEVVAERLEVPLDKLGEYAGKSRSPAHISSMCVVFAETEIIGLLSMGTPTADIIAGVQNSIAQRLLSMSGKNLLAPIVFTGGVALVSGMDKTLFKTLQKEVLISSMPQFTGALGAAIIASEM